MKTGQESAVIRSIQIYPSRKTQFKAYALLMLHQRYYLHIQRLAYNYKRQKCKEHEEPDDGIGSCLLLEILFEIQRKTEWIKTCQTVGDKEYEKIRTFPPLNLTMFCTKFLND